MVTGGSLGAMAVNQAVRDALPGLLEKYNVVHLCGKNKVDNMLLTTPGYTQFEYIKDGMKDLFALADVIISRAGANAICEILALHKPNILIPLPSKASRGDQLLNAKSFESAGYSVVLDQDDLTSRLICDTVDSVYAERDKYISAMKNSAQKDAVSVIVKLIKELA